MCYDAVGLVAPPISLRHLCPCVCIKLLTWSFEQDAQTVTVDHQPRPGRCPDLSVMKILETQLAEIGVILLVLAHPVSRSASGFPPSERYIKKSFSLLFSFSASGPTNTFSGVLMTLG
jgi:hypothetical protein